MKYQKILIFKNEALLFGRGFWRKHGVKFGANMAQVYLDCSHLINKLVSGAFGNKNVSIY